MDTNANSVNGSRQQRSLCCLKVVNGDDPFYDLGGRSNVRDDLIDALVGHVRHLLFIALTYIVKLLQDLSRNTGFYSLVVRCQHSS